MLKQVADLRGGEPPKFELHTKKPVTATTAEGKEVSSKVIELPMAEMFRDELMPLVKAKKAVVLDVPVEAVSFKRFDLSPGGDRLQAELTPDLVEDWTGQAFHPAVS